jgi:hypothetical protein
MQEVATSTARKTVMTRSIRLTTVAMVMAMTLGIAGPALAAPGKVDQRGLVNVNVGDVTVQLPIAIAANICDVNVNVLAVQLRNGGAECDADAESGAVLPGVGGGGGGDVDQRGLVNVNVGDVILQLPVAIAANVCDVNVNVLAVQLRNGGAECDAVAESDAG